MRCQPWSCSASISFRSCPRHARHFPFAPRSIWIIKQQQQYQVRHSGTFRQALFAKYFASIKTLFFSPLPREESVDLVASEMAPGQPHQQQQQMRLVQRMLGLQKASALPDDEFRDVCFVCVDCEAFEFAQEKITEIGVSVLDMREVHEGGQISDVSAIESDDFIEKMRYAHYRITEYGKLVNRRWVKGYPDKFTFGQSVWINRADARHVLERVFRDPASLATAHQTITLPSGGAEAGVLPRKIVIVGHDLSSDTNYLKHLDFDMGALPNVVEKIDTQRMASTKKNRIGLSRLLKALDVQAQFLHNAGNDAAYTMQALVLMAMRDYKEPGSICTAIGKHQPKPPATQDGKELRSSRRERKRLEWAHRQGVAGKSTEGDEKVDETRPRV